MRSGNRQPLGISALCGRLLTAVPVSPLDEVVRTLVSRIPQVHLYLSKQIGVRSSMTSQCGQPIGVKWYHRDHQGFGVFLKFCWSAK